MTGKTAFFKCFACSKNFRANLLIEMNGNAVQINDEEISYEDLVFDVSGFKINTTSPNHICTECDNSLLNFHFFKRTIKKYPDFREYLQKLELISKIEEFIDSGEGIEDFCIRATPDSLTISKQFEEIHEDPMGDEPVEAETTVVTKYEEEQAMDHEEFVIDDSKNFKNEQLHGQFAPDPTFFVNFVRTSSSSTPQVECQRENFPKDKRSRNFKTLRNPTEQRSIKNIKEIPKNRENIKKTPENLEETLDTSEPSPDTIEIETSEIIEEFLEETDDHQIPNSSTKKRRINTLDDLTPVQVSWVREEVASSEFHQDSKKFFRCSQCQCVLSTQASLTRHLRDLHVLKNGKDEKIIAREAVNNSKITINGETFFKCMKCETDRVYKSAQTFKLHMRMVHIRTTKVDTAFIAACKSQIEENGKARDVWICPDCSRVFRNRDTLRNHIKIEHPNMNEDEARNKMKNQKTEVSEDDVTRIAERLELGRTQSFCAECGLKFGTNKNHMKPKVHKDCHETFKILSPFTTRHKCESCRMIFNSSEALVQHVMVHENPEDVLLLPAEGLAVHGASFYRVPAGDADDAVDEAIWKCGHCPVRYFDENDCVSHILLLHSPQIYCFVDNRMFEGSTGLSRYVQHMKNKHPELFPGLKYPCGSCGEEFSTIYDKLGHQKLCESKKFECDHCEKRFQTKHQLQSHILYEIGLAGFNCEICGKRCKTQSDLKIHLNIHTENRPYPCSLCPKTFKTPAARSSHMESHTSEGFECEVCNKKLSNRTLYKRHMKFQHNPEFRESQHEKFNCTICVKSFLRPAHFAVHMKNVHGVEQSL